MPKRNHTIPSRVKVARYVFICCLITAITAASLLSHFSIKASSSFQTTLTPIPPIPTPTINRLSKPTVSERPSQVEKGMLTYWVICMACHGDRGQGLTDEWRDVYGQDRNCWQSKCHASNHPPQGFELPHIVPAVTGTGTLTRFEIAQQLYDYAVVTMPWWNPTSLTTEKGWALTAYLLQLNETFPKNIYLDSTSASAIPVHYLVKAVGHNYWGEIFLVILLILAASAMVFQSKVKNLSKDEAAVIKKKRALSERKHKPNFFIHLHPPTIPALQARWRYTLGAGGLGVFLSLILLVTGLLEMFYYIPDIDQATISVQTIAHLVPYGGFIRNLHYWSAQALVIVVTLHLLRVILTGAYKQPRRFNYLLGITMLILVLALDFTGYILRWDEGVRWALIAGTNLLKTVPILGDRLYQLILGGVQPGTATLIRFYSWHIFGLTLVMIIVGIWHVFRIRRDGGIAIPPPKSRKIIKRISRYDLVRSEILAMLVAAIFLLLISIFWPAPVSPPITDLSGNLENAYAPWFFLWVQQLLKYGDPFLLGVLAPMLVLLMLIFIPYAFPKPADEELGRWFPRSGRVAQIVVMIFILLIFSITIWALLPDI